MEIEARSRSKTPGTANGAVMPMEIGFTKKLFFSSEIACTNEAASASFEAIEFHRLHPFFPSNPNMHTKTEFLLNLAVRFNLKGFYKKIMVSFVLFFCATKLIALARRVKQHM